MARFLVTGVSTTVDGMAYKKGDVVNVHQTHKDVVGNANLKAVPRARITDMNLSPDYFVAVPTKDQLGRKHESPQELAKENVIVEPVLPTENKQYD